MRRILALLLVLVFTLSACSPKNVEITTSAPVATVIPSGAPIPQETALPTITPTPPEAAITPVPPVADQEETSADGDIGIDFTGLNDPNLHRYIEDSVYEDLVSTLDSDEYFVENVSAIYVSKEYLEEIAYNSQANIFFGFTLAEITEQFTGTKFVFTLGDDGQTTVKAFEGYDDTFDKALVNVAVGTGVILLCVTVSVVTGGAAPAVCSIFAASAKTAATFALSGGLFSGVAAGVVTGAQTGDFDESLKAAALAGSEGFMWGAVSGSITGGVSQAVALKGATLNGLTMNQAAAIQRESKYPLEIIKTFHSVDEYNIYKASDLIAKKIGDRWALIRKVDLNYYDKASELTNAERIRKKLAPIDPDSGVAYELHHIGQKTDSPLAILTKKDHQGKTRILHDPTIDEGVQAQLGSKWDVERNQFWQAYLEAAEGGFK